jgi:hypothetical protein
MRAATLSGLGYRIDSSFENTTTAPPTRPVRVRARHAAARRPHQPPPRSPPDACCVPSSAGACAQRAGRCNDLIAWGW